ncbi:DUF4124 domain-containing protein [Aquincola sp. S2]|uniref:DUF4124 domain-containing protein n=1 Tax=Pseudaquabacterium terrae TaxID=2732868 RepID=A0ABX2EN89_9BURK|nr:DUF4124 domain-containing protein [Aquabacterium terrae]NRF70083.1 DUF4124 domain-containing protein [Aquabacterium terrae]
MQWDRALWIATAALMVALPVHAQWKWKDGKGQVHISDLPPPREVPEKDVLQRPSEVKRAPAAPAASAPAAASAAVAQAKPRLDPELEARRARAEQEQKAQAKALEDKNAAIRADNCQRAKQNLATLDSGIRITRVNDKGEREFLDDKARAEEVQRVRQVIQSECR